MQPYTSAGPVDPPKTKGTVSLVLGVILVIVGIVGGIALVAGGAVDISKAVREYQRVPADGGGHLDLDAGKHYLFYEAPTSAVSSDPRGFVTAPAVVIVGPDEQQIRLDYSNSTSTYDIGSRHGRFMGTFQAPTAGSYWIRTVQTDGAVGRPGELAVGTTNPLGSLGAILGGVFGGGAVVIVGVVLLIVGGIRRSKSKRPPPGAYGYPGGAYAAGAGALPGWGPSDPGAPAGPPGWAPPPASAPGWAPPTTQQPWSPPPPAPPAPPSWSPPPASSPPAWPPRPEDPPSSDSPFS